ncbi:MULTISPECIES: hypothetical protein [Nitrospirillum]|jgi:hypothetical protein|uniref:Uncharacterized protein n=2 Tax=Nitrospirillum TaxID=1543705 RepID=A0A248JRY6_9PROT|nr:MULTISPECIES: hypothetical protein [Nitrospirillum]ASG20848.1 hypothetical protein Y958_08515 [Nitrospirillum amazonense CBAmc]EGY00403.1 hypothetical protein AZA_89538 [Nitrospirillum amazonense Y2]MEA1676591.1 hypothetical protein [Nitrospirillum sp. BR 11163]MEC4591360.1 hypothetical protein [Nitrospirillum amazonense]TWB16725.1 hypothetical protein FBZ89_113135 [Nitrospirillum amazonense]
MSRPIPQNNLIERTSVLTYTLMEQLHDVLNTPSAPDDVTLGMLMGLSMFLDDQIGPFRMTQLLQAAPDIILRTDAHVTRDQIDRFLPVLRAFGDKLAALTPETVAEPTTSLS